MALKVARLIQPKRQLYAVSYVRRIFQTRILRKKLGLTVFCDLPDGGVEYCELVAYKRDCGKTQITRDSSRRRRGSRTGAVDNAFGILGILNLLYVVRHVGTDTAAHAPDSGERQFWCQLLMGAFSYFLHCAILGINEVCSEFVC